MAQFREDRSELLHFDDPEFPVQYRKNFIPKDAVLDGMIFHWHEEVEFIYVLKGSVDYQLNKKHVHMEAGEGIFVNARQLHLIIPAGEDCELYCLIFQPLLLAPLGQLLGDYVAAVIKNEALPYLMLNKREAWKARVLDDIAKLEECKCLEPDKTDEGTMRWYRGQEGDGRELAVMSVLYDIWLQLYEHMPRERKEYGESGSDVLSMKHMLFYIHENFREKIVLTDIIKQGNVGKTKCTKLFSEYLHMTPIEYVNYYRVTEAMKLLCETDLSMTQIASQCGFESVSYFGEVFKQRKGISPRGFRKQYEDENAKKAL